MFSRFFGLKQNESVLVVTDKNKKDIAEGICDMAREISSQVILVEMPVTEAHGEEPPENVAKLMPLFDVIVAVTTRSISHTDARMRAQENGARIASMPGITKDVFERAVDSDSGELTLHLKDILDNGSEVRIKTEKGTDVSFSIKGRKSTPDYGDLKEKGSFDNLPSGECFIAPLEDSANGKVIVDGSMGEKLDEEAVIEFSGGVASVKGEPEKFFRDMPREAFVIAELGIGTNENAEISGITLEDEKVMGTCHIALGKNTTFGGKNYAPIHIDGIIKEPDIYVDDKQIMEKGEFL